MTMDVTQRQSKMIKIKKEAFKSLTTLVSKERKILNPKKVTEDITEQLRRQGIRCAPDVDELYLANNGYNHIPSLAEYRALHLLWLNNNKIFKVDFLQRNYQITELYLQNNMVVSIGGALKHLSCLQILMLHANQLTCSQTTTKELKNMLGLHTLNLFGNPIAQEEFYRSYVIHNVKSLKLLDRQSVSYAETCAAKRMFDKKQVRIQESIKFGRREFKPCSDPDTQSDRKLRYRTISSYPLPSSRQPARHNATPMSYSIFDWETLGREFLYSKARSPPSKLTVSIQ